MLKAHARQQDKNSNLRHSCQDGHNSTIMQLSTVACQQSWPYIYTNPLDPHMASKAGQISVQDQIRSDMENHSSMAASRSANEIYANTMSAEHTSETSQ